MWGKHVIEIPVAEVEVAKIQRCNLFLVCVNCTYPLWEVRSEQGVLKVSRHTIVIYCASQRWYICG
jgi:hypothetical protein